MGYLGVFYSLEDFYIVLKILQYRNRWGVCMFQHLNIKNTVVKYMIGISLCILVSRIRKKSKFTNFLLSVLIWSFFFSSDILVFSLRIFSLPHIFSFNFLPLFRWGKKGWSQTRCALFECNWPFNESPATSSRGVTFIELGMKFRCGQLGWLSPAPLELLNHNLHFFVLFEFSWIARLG